MISEPFIGRGGAMVHEADIAAVTVAALTQDGHGGKTYTVTGPCVLTVQDKVDALSEAIGREIGLVELTEAQAREKWAAEGVPADISDRPAWTGFASPTRWPDPDPPAGHRGGLNIRNAPQRGRDPLGVLC